MSTRRILLSTSSRSALQLGQAAQRLDRLRSQVAEAEAKKKASADESR